MDIAHIITLSIVLFVLGLGLNSTRQDALHLLSKPGLLLRSVLSMYVIYPLVALGFVMTFDLPASVKVALIALSVSPVPPLLPSKQLRARGYMPYVMSLFAVTALLAIVTVPVTVSWITQAFDQDGGVSALKVAKTVLVTVIVPLAVGVAWRHWAPASAAKLARPMTLIGLGLLLVGGIPLVYTIWPTMRALIGNGVVLIIAVLALIGLGVGHALGGPSLETRAVLALSTASRHPAVALAVAIASGTESRTALAAILLYVLVAMLVSFPYVAWCKHQAAMLSLPPNSTTGARP